MADEIAGTYRGWSPKKKKKKTGRLPPRKHVSTLKILEKRKTKVA